MAKDLGAAEFYPTPAWVVRLLIERIPFDLFGGLWCEPCVGEGAIVEAFNEYAPDPARRWSGYDLRATQYAKYNGYTVGDYLASNPPRAHVCVMNPPFKRGLQFVRKARTHCDHVFMLHRRNWLVSALRTDREWLEHNPPAELLIPDRISFYGGSSDSQEYEWYAWTPAVSGLHFLPSTSLEQRRQPLRKDRKQLDLFGGNDG